MSTVNYDRQVYTYRTRLNPGSLSKCLEYLYPTAAETVASAQHTTLKSLSGNMFDGATKGYDVVVEG